jgi:hypothetical protein
MGLQKEGLLLLGGGGERGVSESSFVVFLHNGGEKKAIAIERDFKRGSLLVSC